jgi:hypothetical protein
MIAILNDQRSAVRRRASWVGFGLEGTLVTVGNDHIFDQVQHFIPSEVIIAGTYGRLFGQTYAGVDRATLVIQRWGS